MNIDQFPAGFMVTNAKRHITFLNSYFEEEFNISVQATIGASVDVLFSKATCIFLESYFYPTLLSAKIVSEIQVTVLALDGSRIPAVVNAELTSNGDIYWALFTAVSRDKLYQELLKTREQLEAKTLRLTAAATTDDLTGLLNRREASRLTKAYLDQSYRSGIDLAFIILDIDHFKLINDNYGHPHGDSVLVELSAILSRAGRSTDIFSRWGGEEFLIVLYGSHQAEAKAFCLSLHHKVSEILVGTNPLRVSMGIACLSNPDQSPNKQKPTLETLIGQADKALYEAKRLGRNQTQCFNELG